jgi:hypothetical protein
MPSCCEAVGLRPWSLRLRAAVDRGAERRLEDGDLSVSLPNQKKSPDDGILQPVITLLGCGCAIAVAGCALGQRSAADVLPAGCAE